MEEIVRLMNENKIKDTTVEHTGEICDGCGKDLKIVRIKFENGEVKENKSGCIINISSIYGISGGSCAVGYSAAKAGMDGFTKALAKELGPSGIRVNSIAPGIIDTQMNSQIDEKTISIVAPICPQIDEIFITRPCLFLIILLTAFLVQ